MIPAVYRQSDIYEGGSELQKFLSDLLAPFLLLNQQKHSTPSSLEATENQIKLLKQDVSLSLTTFQDVFIHPVQS